MSGTVVTQPSNTWALVNADSTVANTDQRVLMVGQQTAAASADDGALETQIGQAGEEDELYGPDSQLAAMIREFRKINKVVRIDAIGLDDSGTTFRIVGFTVAVTTAEAGTITVVAGSEVNHSFEVAIAAADTATAIADAITVAVNADANVPFTCENTAGAVTLTAVNAGTVANDLGVEVTVAATGVTIDVALAEGTAGATDPDPDGILDIATLRYQTIVWPYETTAEVEAYLAAREDPTNAILDGVAFVNFQPATAAASIAVTVQNDRNIVMWSDKQTSEVSGTIRHYLGPAMNEASYVKSAQIAAIHSLRLTDGENIASFVTSTASRDQIGGTALGSLPYFNTPVANLPLIAAGRGWTQTEIETIFDGGGSVIGVNPGGTDVILGEVVTTFLTDAASNADPTFKFLNYVVTTSNIREYIANNLRADLAQSRLTDGALIPGRDMHNGASIKAMVEKLYQDLSGPDFVLVQGGDVAFKFVKDNLTVTTALATGTVTILLKAPIIVQTRTVIGTIKIAFSTTS